MTYCSFSTRRSLKSQKYKYECCFLVICSIGFVILSGNSTKVRQKTQIHSKAEKYIKVNIDDSTANDIIQELRKKRKKILKEINEPQKIIRNKEIDSITNDIENAQYDHQFCKAINLIESKIKNIVLDKEQYKTNEKNMMI